MKFEKLKRLFLEREAGRRSKSGEASLRGQNGPSEQMKEVGRRLMEEVPSGQNVVPNPSPEWAYDIRKQIEYHEGQIRRLKMMRGLIITQGPYEPQLSNSARTHDPSGIYAAGQKVKTDSNGNKCPIWCAFTEPHYHDEAETYLKFVGPRGPSSEPVREEPDWKCPFCPATRIEDCQNRTGRLCVKPNSAGDGS